MTIYRFSQKLRTKFFSRHEKNTGANLHISLPTSCATSCLTMNVCGTSRITGFTKRFANWLPCSLFGVWQSDGPSLHRIRIGLRTQGRCLATLKSFSLVKSVDCLKVQPLPLGWHLRKMLYERTVTSGTRTQLSPTLSCRSLRAILQDGMLFAVSRFPSYAQGLLARMALTG